MGQILSVAIRGNQTWDILTLDFYPLELWDNVFLLFRPPSLWYFVKAVLTNWSEKVMAPHSSTLAWRIPWMEESGGLQSMGLLQVGHDWATSLSLFTFMHRRRKWQPTPVFLPGESQGRGARWAAVYGFGQSRTRLKWLSGSSSSNKLILLPHRTFEKIKCKAYGRIFLT